MTDEWNLSKKIVYDADAMKSLCAFQFFSYLIEMLYHMIRNDEMKLCDKNVLKHDDEVSLIMCDSYD